MGARKSRRGGTTALAIGICTSVMLAGCSSSGPSGKPAKSDSKQSQSTKGSASDGAIKPNLPYGDPPGDGGTPVRGGSITIAAFHTVNSFDPIQKLSMPATAIYGQLLKYDDKGEPKPLLARSMTASNGAKTWTLGLRPDVKFQDGTTLDAEAVIFNIKRHMSNAGSPPHGYTENIKSVKAIDPLTVRFELKTSDAGFAALFAENPSVATLGVVASPTAVKKWGTDYTNHPVGAGPFKFVSWSRGSKVVVKRFDGYWQKGLPYLDQITFVPRSDTQTRDASLKNGEVSLIETGGPQDYLALADDPDLKYYLDGAGASFEVFNFDKPPFNDIRMRKAAAMAINFDDMSAALYDGKMIRAKTIIGPGSAFYSKDAAAAFPAYNPTEAKKLVEEYKSSGKDPSFTLQTSNSPEAIKQAQFLQAQWQAVGMTVKTKFQDLASWIVNISAGKFQIGGNSSHGSANPYPLLEKTFGTGASHNPGHYSNPKVDAMLKEAKLATDPAKRKSLYDRVQVLVNQDVVDLWFSSAQLGLIAHRNVHGVGRAEGGPTYFEKLWLGKSK